MINYVYSDNGVAEAGYAEPRTFGGVDRALAELTGESYRKWRWVMNAHKRRLKVPLVKNLPTQGTEEMLNRCGFIKVLVPRHKYFTLTEVHQRVGNCIVVLRNGWALCLKDGALRAVKEVRLRRERDKDGNYTYIERKTRNIWIKPKEASYELHEQSCPDENLTRHSQ